MSMIVRRTTLPSRQSTARTSRRGRPPLFDGCLVVLLLVCCRCPPPVVTAYFATTPAVLIAQAKGIIPNAYGPVTAKVSSTANAITIQFGLVAGKGYTAGIVTVTTNSQGQVIKLAKGRQSCSVAYTAAGAIRTVTCKTSRRKLGRSLPAQEGDDESPTDEGMGWDDEPEQDRESERRLAASCKSCTNLVSGAFAAKIKKAMCGTAFSSRVPKKVRWAASAAASLCGMTTKLGTPAAIAKKTCRCCTQNAECPHGVCSAEACLTTKIATGVACPDGEDADCANGVCGISSFPNGSWVCCPSGDYIGSYCSNQRINATCGINTMCSSGVCSGGFCLTQRIANGTACPDREDEDCANRACARSSYPNGGYVCCPSGNHTSSPGTTERYCTGSQGSGLRCANNEMCASGICSAGICLAQRIGDGSACPDFEDNDCNNYACARSSYPNGAYVCCPGGAYLQSPTTADWYCMGQGTGSLCFENRQCSSGICSAGVCISGFIAAGEPCPDKDDWDCNSGACARRSYPDGGFICCPSGYVRSPSSGEKYCDAYVGSGSPCESNSICTSGTCSAGICLSQKIANGMACPDGDSSDCASGECARNSYPSGSNACCSNGQRVYSYTTGEQFCTGIQGSALPCDSNVLCASGYCSTKRGICLSQRIASGQACPDNDNNDCASGACSAGICLSQKIANGMACPDGDSSDCASGACARNSYPSGSNVCCSSGQYVYSGATRARYCLGVQGSGLPCDSNEFCSSGVCSAGICLSQKIANGMACPDREGNDCASRACARSSYPGGGYVCCPTGQYDFSFNPFDVYCTEQGSGSSCFSNKLCSSGVCSAGTCLSQKIASGMACPDGDGSDCASGICSASVCLSQKIANGLPCPDGEGSDCANRACGRSSYPSGDYICCPSNHTVERYPHRYCTRTQGPGSRCFLNEMCFSGVCSAGVCLAQRIAIGEAWPCSTNHDCASGICSASVCLSEKLADGELCTDFESYHCDFGFCNEVYPNSNGFNCANRACARISYPSGRYVCCRSGAYVYSHAKADWYCARTQRSGFFCDSNEICRSGNCSLGVCS